MRDRHEPHESSQGDGAFSGVREAPARVPDGSSPHRLGPYRRPTPAGSTPLLRTHVLRCNSGPRLLQTVKPAPTVATKRRRMRKDLVGGGGATLSLMLIAYVLLQSASLPVPGVITDVALLVAV